MSNESPLQCALCAALSTERAAVVQACAACGSRMTEPAPPTVLRARDAIARAEMRLACAEIAAIISFVTLAAVMLAACA